MAPKHRVQSDTVSRRTALAGLCGAGIGTLAGCSAITDFFDDDTIDASGSNTVRPLTAAVAEEFEDDVGGTVNVEGPGTGAGFEEFTQGNTDIQNASRDASEEERNAAEDNDIEFTRFQVGQDGIVVYLHPDNDFVDYLTVDELEAIYEFESDIETWDEVPIDRDPDWPNEEIDIWGRDSDSGTFDFFTETLTGEAGNVRTDYNDRTETQAVVEGVSENEFAIGFGGYSFLAGNPDLVDGAAIQDRGEDEAFEPTPDNIEAGNYTPLTRPLYIFVNHDLFEREIGRDFIRYYFDNVGEIAPEVEFFPAPDDVLDDNHDTMDDILDDLGVDE